MVAKVTLPGGRSASSQGVGPVDVLIPEGTDSQLTVQARTVGYYDETAQLSHDGKTDRWTTNNPSAHLLIGQKPLILNVYLGRIRFSPVIQQSEVTVVPQSFNPQAILIDDRPFYRTVWQAPTKFRTLKTNVVGDVNGQGWDRFNFNETDVQMDVYGTWVLLEYGDPQPFGNVRQLIGVWAPFHAGAKPVVVVQVTPNPFSPYYPLDQLPFTGVYPYQCLLKSPPSPQKTQFQVSDFKQPYAELGANRTLTAWKIAYQIYAARTDIFGVEAGPVIITPIPAALTSGGVLREPFNCQEGIGRLVGEVLRFLWSQGITNTAGGKGGKLLFKDGTTSFDPSPNDSPPDGFPTSSASTLVGHSAAVFAMYDIARIPSLEILRSGSVRAATVDLKRLAHFAQDFYGGPTSYFSQDWRGLWIIDGVSNPGQGLSPTAGSDAANTWLHWLSEQPTQRAICAVYTPSGIAAPLVNGLVACLAQDTKSGTAGAVAEKKKGQISWLRFTTSYLRATAAQTDTSFLPIFSTPPDPQHPIDTHNEIYSFGVGYAAQAFR